MYDSVGSMNKTRIVIVEDEALIADHIAMCLEDMGYEVAGIEEEGHAALELIDRERPDLCMLDINLAGALDGVDIAQEIKRRFGIPFIFLTSNSNKRTIERVKMTEPAGFILKPYTVEDLETNLGIILYKLKQVVHQAGHAGQEGQKENSFFIREKHELIRVHYDDISHIEAMDNYSRIHTAKGRFVLSQTLKTVEKRLEPYGFLRVHRSYVVNLSRIDLIAPRHLELGEVRIPISEAQRQKLMERISIF